jgi:hypothetical protein
VLCSKGQEWIGVAPLKNKMGFPQSDNKSKVAILTEQFQSVFTKENLNNFPNKGKSPYSTMEDIKINSKGVQPEFFRVVFVISDNFFHIFLVSLSDFPLYFLFKSLVPVHVFFLFLQSHNKSKVEILNEQFQLVLTKDILDNFPKKGKSPYSTMEDIKINSKGIHKHLKNLSGSLHYYALHVP